MNRDSTRATVPGTIRSFIEVCRDHGAELWLVYRISEEVNCTCRLAFVEGGQQTWVGGAFPVPADQFLYLGALRDQRRGAIRLDNCSSGELNGFFEGVRIPFSFGWSMPDV